MIIRNILQKTSLKPPLGRWNIETCDKKLNNKIDLANQDHCGPCGKYIKHVNLKESDKSVHSNNIGMFQSSIQKFMGISDISKNILRIDDISKKKPSQLNILNEINQPTYLQVYLPTYLPTYLPAYKPTNLHIHRKNFSKFDI
jgi:hypothetical protein